MAVRNKACWHARHAWWIELPKKGAISQSLSFCTIQLNSFTVSCVLGTETLSFPPTPTQKQNPRQGFVCRHSVPLGEKRREIIKGKAASTGCVTKRPPVSGQLELSPAGECWETAEHAPALLLCQVLVCFWLRAQKVELSGTRCGQPWEQAAESADMDPVWRGEAGKGHSDNICWR